MYDTEFDSDNDFSPNISMALGKACLTQLQGGVLEWQYDNYDEMIAAAEKLKAMNKFFHVNVSYCTAYGKYIEIDTITWKITNRFNLLK